MCESCDHRNEATIRRVSWRADVDGEEICGKESKSERVLSTVHQQIGAVVNDYQGGFFGGAECHAAFEQAERIQAGFSKVQQLTVEDFPRIF